jgi:hypothetical protein
VAKNYRNVISFYRNNRLCDASLKTSFSGMCSTTTYSKSNGAIACGYDIQPGLNWNQAATECARVGGRLPEIADARENNEIFLRKVFVSFVIFVI